MRILVLALALLPAAALAGDRDPAKRPVAPALSPSGKVCQNSDLHKVAPAGQQPKLRKLDREPPAQTYYTVLRLEDGCDKPVLVGRRR